MAMTSKPGTMIKGQSNGSTVTFDELEKRREQLADIGRYVGVTAYKWDLRWSYPIQDESSRNSRAFNSMSLYQYKNSKDTGDTGLLIIEKFKGIIGKETRTALFTCKGEPVEWIPSKQLYQQANFKGVADMILDQAMKGNIKNPGKEALYKIMEFLGTEGFADVVYSIWNQTRKQNIH